MALPLVSKLVIAAVVVGSGAYLVLSDSGEGVLEYVYVHQVTENPARFAGRTFKVHGTVVEGRATTKHMGFTGLFALNEVVRTRVSGAAATMRCPHDGAPRHNLPTPRPRTDPASLAPALRSQRMSATAVRRVTTSPRSNRANARKA